MNLNNPGSFSPFQIRQRRRARDLRYRRAAEDYSRYGVRYGARYAYLPLIDGVLRPAPGRRNREIDDGGLD